MAVLQNKLCFLAGLAFFVAVTVLFPYRCCGKCADVHTSAKSPFKVNEEDVASLKGADMTFYRMYRDEMDEDKAMEYAEIFLSGIDTSEASRVCAEMSDRLSVYYEKSKFMFSKSIMWREKSLDIYADLGDNRMVAESEYALSKLYYKTGQYHRTLMYTYDALQRFEKDGDDLRVLDCYNLLGMVFHLCRNMEQSKLYFSMYIEGVKKHNDSSRLVYALNNAAVLENALRDSVKTRKLIEESMSIASSLQDTTVLCQVCLNSVGMSMNVGMFETAWRYLKKVVPFVGDNIEYKGRYYQYKGLLNMADGNYDAAVTCLDSAVYFYSQGEFMMRLQDCYAKLEAVYSASGDVENAYKALKKYYEIESGLSKNDIFLELFRSQNNVILQKEREKFLEQQNSRRTVWTIVVVIVVLAVLLFIQYTVRRSEQIRIKEAELKNRQLENEKNEQEIRSKNEMLEIKKMQQFQLDRMAKEIEEKLLSLGSEIKEASVRNRIREICSGLSFSRNDGQWKEISCLVPEFNGEFFNRLLKDFPDLTVNERRLCALLNMNLSTKEISEITRQSIKSINVARTRLRTKLGISGGDITIQEFLSKYN